MSYRTIEYVVNDGVLIITLNRPEQLNAFTTQMADELEAAFQRASVDDEVRAIVVTGAGRAFCAGMDLSTRGNVFGLDETQSPTMADMYTRLEDEQIRDGVRDTGGRVTLAIFECTKPVIAAINGPAIGVGATITLAMDVRLASHRASIGFVFGRIGIVPESCSTWFLPRVVGMSQALEWVLSAEILDAETARSGGLLKDVYEPTELLEAALTVARKMTAGRSAVATALTRRMMYLNSAQPHPIEAHRVESLAMFSTSMGDGLEGVQAFIEKRPPVFTSRISADMPSFYPWATEN